MKNLTRVAASVASVGALALAVPAAANAADASLDAGKSTCYVNAKKPFIVGGVGTTAKGTGVVYCQGGGVTMRLTVSLQKSVNGYWRQQGAATTCQGFVGAARKQCSDTNRATIGLWRTKVVATIIGGPTRTFYSATQRFVPARQGGFTI